MCNWKRAQLSKQSRAGPAREWFPQSRLGSFLCAQQWSCPGLLGAETQLQTAREGLRPPALPWQKLEKSELFEQIPTGRVAFSPSLSKRASGSCSIHMPACVGKATIWDMKDGSGTVDPSGPTDVPAASKTCFSPKDCSPLLSRGAAWGWGTPVQDRHGSVGVDPEEGCKDGQGPVRTG